MEYVHHHLFYDLTLCFKGRQLGKNENFKRERKDILIQKRLSLKYVHF